MANFKVAYQKTMASEGGYSYDPADRGGETWKGVARNMHPDWKGWDIIDRKRKQPGFPGSLKKDEELEICVQQFYKKYFWDTMNLDDYESQGIADELFDTGVNMGVGTAVKFLQRSLNVFNKEQTLYPNISVDGSYGPGTHKALKSFMSQVPRDRWICLYKALNALQGVRYIEIAEKNESQEKFMFGWFTRVFEAV